MKHSQENENPKLLDASDELLFHVPDEDPLSALALSTRYRRLFRMAEVNTNVEMWDLYWNKGTEMMRQGLISWITDAHVAGNTLVEMIMDDYKTITFSNTTYYESKDTLMRSVLLIMAALEEHLWDINQVYYHMMNLRQAELQSWLSSLN